MDDTHRINFMSTKKEEEVLVSKREYGPPIGTFLGKPIYQTITEQEHQYVFDRLADCDDDGCPLDQLNNDELMLQPGLIYKIAV